LLSVFKKDGTVTKGNACGLNDGAAAVVLASKSSAESLGLNKVAKIVCSAVVGWYLNILLLKNKSFLAIPKSWDWVQSLQSEN
jgi:acetyl-CoA acetyltransferase